MGMFALFLYISVILGVVTGGEVTGEISESKIRVSALRNVARVKTFTEAALDQSIVNGALVKPVFGRFDELGYYTVNVAVGTPPQLLSLILDSGSATTMFVCDTCTACATHTHVFNTSKSNTLGPVACDDKCNRCGEYPDGKTGCAFRRSFAEGSSVSGLFYQDHVSLYDASDIGKLSRSYAEAKNLQFGCLASESGMFQNGQKADGVIGLSQGRTSLLKELLQAKTVQKNVLSVCFSEVGGILAYGSELANMRLTPYQKTRMHVTQQNGWYVVGVSRVRLRNAPNRTAPAPDGRLLLDGDDMDAQDSVQAARLAESADILETLPNHHPSPTPAHGRILGASAQDPDSSVGKARSASLVSRRRAGRMLGEWFTGGLDASGTPVVVDTGSTFTYVPDEVLQFIISGLRTACNPQTIDTVSGQVMYSSSCRATFASERDTPSSQLLCLRMDSDMSFDAFPVLDLHMADGASYTVSARQYLQEMTWTRPLACLGIFSTSVTGGKSILGANLMQHTELVFDAEQSTLAWAPAACPLQGGLFLHTTEAADGTNDASEPELVIVAEGSGGSIIVSAVLFALAASLAAAAGVAVYRLLKRQRAASPSTRAQGSRVDFRATRATAQQVDDASEDFREDALPDDMEDFIQRSASVKKRGVAAAQGTQISSPSEARNKARG